MILFQTPLGASAWMLSEAAMERLGWVLLHSLWQFLLISILTYIVLRFVRQSSAGLRYVLLVFSMVACAASPVATWLSLSTDNARVASENRKASTVPLPLESMHSAVGVNDEAVIVGDTQGAIAELPSISNLPSFDKTESNNDSSYRWVSAEESLRPWLASVVIAWGLGVMFCSLRPLLSWIAIRRLRRVGATPVCQDVAGILLNLSERMAVRRPVDILQSTLVHVPLVFGWLRPMILLPASLLTNLPTSQLEAIIAHELAHVRRHDFLVNLLQTIIETLFFYHPAIWWLSHRIRIERENCCDDLVIRALGNRVEYGRALVAIEQLRAESIVLAVGVSDGSMLARIRRIAGHPSDGQSSSSWSLMSVLASILPVVVIIGLIGWHSIAASSVESASERISDEPILEASFREEVTLKLTRKVSHQGKWYFVDLDQGKLKTPPFDVKMDATRFPYFVTKPSEEELNDWLKREGVDLILRSSIYRPDPKGPIEKNEIQVRSVRTLLKELPSGLEKEIDNSWAWKQTVEEDVLAVFGAKDDTVHVVGFVPNATAVDIRPESPFLRSFRTASNLLGVFLLEQPNSNDDELKLRIAYIANKEMPLDDLRFGPDDFVSGIESLEQTVARKRSEAPFVAKFPNDVRVEFVGLSRGVGDIKAADKWWRPDGSPLEQAPEHRGVSGVLKEGEVESDTPFVRTVIHVHGIGDNNAVTATAAMQNADSLKDESGGLYVAHHGYGDAPGRTKTFEVGVAADAPSPKRWLDRNGQRIESKTESVKDPIAEDIIIEKVGPESWGKGGTSKGGMTDPVGPSDQKMGNLAGTTQVTIRFPLAWRNVDLRLYAIDKSGNSHTADFTITLDPNDENADYKRLAKVIPVDYSEVDHFEYQFRVYRHWAIFENVSLWKGTQTEVVMKSETIPKTSVNSLSSTVNTSEPQPTHATEASDSAKSAAARHVKKTNRVVDAQGKPVASAKIACLPSMKYSWLEAPKSLGSTVTDSGGWFDYPDGLPPKERFYVYVSADGFLERVFQANNGEAYVLENGIRKPDTLALRRPVTVSGKILGIDGKPLADAEIAVDYMFDNGVAQINGNRVKSDAEGRFVAKGVEPAHVFVRYETPYKTNEERMPIGTQPGKLCIVPFTATDGQQKDDIILDLSKCNCIVEGRIVDHEDKGVPDRWIQATITSAKGRLDESITVKSDAEGRFRFEGLTADEFSIGTYTPSLRETVKPSPSNPAIVRLTTYVQGKGPLANEKNPPIFGEASESGIVGGIRIQGGDHRKLGDVITVEVLVKNKSDQVKMFAYSFAEHGNLRAYDGDKEIAELNYSHFTGLTVTTHYRLEPNQEAVVGSFQCGLHDPNDKENGLPKATFLIPCRAGQSLTLRCDMSANLFGRSPEENATTEKEAPLSTGSLSLKVMPTNELAHVVPITYKAPVVANRGTLRGRFVFDGTPPTFKDTFGNPEGIDGSKPQQPGPDGRASGGEALYRAFLAEGIRPDTKAQTLLIGNESGIANIYVWATSKNIPWDVPAEGLPPINVEFRNGRLTEPFIKVVVDQKLQFENRDPVDHSLGANFMKARNTSFNLLVKANSKYEGDWRFPVAEPFPTRLSLGRAPWASGVLFVHNNPYVAITKRDGSFEMENLPIGEWEFQVWHETAGFLMPSREAFQHKIVVGENNLGTKRLKSEVFGIREAAITPVASATREQIGTVQGKPVYRDEIVEGSLVALFTKPSWLKYKETHRQSIELTEKELESARIYFTEQHRVRLEEEGGESKLREQMKQIEDKLSNSERTEEEVKKLEMEHAGLRARLKPPDPSFANFILDNWKLQKHLYENFGGGRILWQQAGLEAFDATRKWLELQEKNGEFQFTDPKIRETFYQYWNQDHGPFLTDDKERIRKEFLQPPWIAGAPAVDDVSQKVPSATNADNNIEKTVLGILQTPFIDDPAKGTWQLGAHDIEVHSKLRALPQRTDVIKTLLKVVDRTVPSSMHERRLAIGFLGGSDPLNLRPRLIAEIENAMANPAKPFAAYHEIEMLGRIGEDARSAMPLLIKLLDSSDGVAYNLALESLTKIGARSPDVMSELAKHTDDPLTVYQLGRYGQMAKAHGPLFVKLLDSPSHEIHTWSAQALVKTGFDETKGFKVLMADVAAGKSEHRCLAATALAALGSRAAAMIPSLRLYENDPDPQVAKAVRESIVRIEKDDRIFTHAEEATKREKALEASAALNPQIPFNLRIVGGEEQTPIAGIEITATNGYGASQKKFGPFLTDAKGSTLCKLPQGFYTLHLKSKSELPFLPYEKFWKGLPPPGMKWIDLRVTGIGVEKWLGGEMYESGVEHAKSSDELTRVTFTLLKPIELVLRAVDTDTGRGLPGVTFYLESAVAEDWAHPIDGANLGASHYRDFDSLEYRTDANGDFKRFITDRYLRGPDGSEWGPKFGIWKAPEGYEAVESEEVAIDFPADNRSSVEHVFHFRRAK